MRTATSEALSPPPRPPLAAASCEGEDASTCNWASAWSGLGLALGFGLGVGFGLGFGFGLGLKLGLGLGLG